MKKRIDQMRQNDENEERQRYQEATKDFNKAEQDRLDQKRQYVIFSLFIFH